MESNNETMLLRVKDIEPTDIVVKNALGKELFIIYQELFKIFIDDFGMKPQWNYYNDGKAWLCKVVYKKKTILWLSLWENFIKLSFYFTQKSGVGISGLYIDNKIKEAFAITKPIGKLIPLIIDIDILKRIDDIKQIIRYKKWLK